MYDLIIKNGLVVSPSSTVKCDVAVNGRKIAGLGHYDESEGKRRFFVGKGEHRWQKYSTRERLK